MEGGEEDGVGEVWGGEGGVEGQHYVDWDAGGVAFGAGEETLYGDA